jgi:hypothetical protein
MIRAWRYCNVIVLLSEGFIVGGFLLHANIPYLKTTTTQHNTTTSEIAHGRSCKLLNYGKVENQQLV